MGTLGERRQIDFYHIFSRLCIQSWGIKSAHLNLIRYSNYI
jgi:hypothetical protein